MITPSLLSLKSLSLPQTFRRPLGVANTAVRVELAFLAKTHQWLYRLQQGIKRLFDIMAASLGLLAISPLLLIIAVLVKTTSQGPILYKSERIGKNYQPFSMYKFRTMCVDADAQREALRQQTEQKDALFKMENDPRVTPIGKFLRAFSLDELPQLLNVVKGDMSLVGPRPLPRDESDLFQDPYTLRFHVYPGITGLWQVSGRSNLPFAKLCSLEMEYVTQWNLLSDLQILFKTVPAVLLSKGAY